MDELTAKETAAIYAADIEEEEADADAAVQELDCLAANARLRETLRWVEQFAEADPTAANLMLLAKVRSALYGP